MTCPAMSIASWSDPDNHDCVLTVGHHVIHTTNKVAHLVMAIIAEVHEEGVTEGRRLLAEHVLNEVKEYVPRMKK